LANTTAAFYFALIFNWSAQVLCALNFYGQGSYQKGVGADAHLGLSQPTVSHAIEEVTEALNKPEIFPAYVKFPTTLADRRNVQER
jgi:hypothetical protein